MELRGEVKGISYNLEGKPLITFEIDRMADVNNIPTLEKDEKLKIKITKQGSNRTVYQNNLMWGIIAEIDRVENGIPTEEGRWNIYTYGIEYMGIEYEDYLIPKEALKAIKKGFRATRVIEEYEDKYQVRCFIGSSRFNKKQMGELIDYFLRYAQELEIPLIDYRAEYSRLF
jgi:hypothetical protein